MTEETRNEPGAGDLRNEADVMMPPTAPAGPPRRRRRKWPWILLAVLIVLPTVLMLAWTAITLNWSYSKGNRTGYVQKFSKKGWVCKTWEGEIAMVNIPGAMQERFEFTVRSDSIANLINRYQGQRVVIDYEQHLGVPTSCFGDTQYFVTGVRAIGP